MPNFCWALTSLVPVFTRGMIMLKFPALGGQVLTREELNREGHRAFILALAGFSFTGLIALAVLDKALQKSFALGTLFLVISFMSFMLALNLQSYKGRRWEDDVATIAADVAVLSMYLSVVAVLLGEDISAPSIIIAAVGIAMWVVDHVIRLRIVYRYRKELRNG